MNTRRSGITLLEILAVMGIIGVIGAMGFPRMAAYQRSVTMLEVANAVAQTLQDTSARAIANSAAQTVTLALNVGTGTDLTITGSSTVTLALERDAKITSAKVGATTTTSVIYDVRGRPNNAATLVITLAFADQTRTVRLLPTGKTVVQ